VATKVDFYGGREIFSPPLFPTQEQEPSNWFGQPRIELAREVVPLGLPDFDAAVHKVMHEP
jgi:hypothetical protein